MESLPFDNIPRELENYIVYDISDTIDEQIPIWFFPPLYKYIEDSDDDALFWFTGWDSVHRLEITGKKSLGIVNINKYSVEPKQSRNLIQQVLLECRSSHAEKIRKGFRYNIESSIEDSWLSPMGGVQFKEKSITSYPVSVQVKIDGIRCLICRRNNKIQAYSRNHTLIMYIEHILKEAKTLIDLLPDKTVLDGELYLPMERADIKSAVVTKSRENKSKFKRPPNAQYLKYYLFDVKIPETQNPLDVVMENRYEKLVNTYNIAEELNEKEFEHIFVIQNHICHSIDDISEWYNYYVDEGHEGVMVKQMANGSKKGKQYEKSLYVGSKMINIMKLKNMEETEVIIHNVVEKSKGAEKTKGMAKFVTYSFGESKPVFINPSGTFEEQRYWYRNPESVIGRTITIRYQNLDRKSGLPQICSMVRFRDENE